MQFIAIKMTIEDPKEKIAFVQAKHKEYKEEIDIYKMASELIIDEIIAPFGNYGMYLQNVSAFIRQKNFHYHLKNIQYILYN